VWLFDFRFLFLWLVSSCGATIFCWH
jgi:hypothetical protein